MERGRGEAGERVRRELADVFGSAPLAHWAGLLASVDCCVTPVLTLDEALADPQFRARAMIRAAKLAAASGFGRTMTSMAAI